MKEQDMLTIKGYINHMDKEMKKQAMDIKKINGRLDNIESEIKKLKLLKYIEKK